jgi:hypothetical protein
MKAAPSVLRQLSLEGLRTHWRVHCRGDVPKHGSRDLLVRAITYQQEAATFGAASRRAQRRLEATAKGQAPSPRPRLSPGIVLVREWNNVPHAVTISDDGFLWQGRHYASLSAVASAITGVKWNGPRFFKLDQAQGTGP